MHQFNFVNKFLIILLFVYLNYNACSIKERPNINEVYKYILDSLVQNSCCDSILITNKFEINLNDKMMYLPKIILENLKIDTNLVKNQENLIPCSNTNILTFFESRPHKPFYTNTISFKEYPINRPEPDHKLTLIISDLFFDGKYNGIIFVSLLTNSTKTFMLVLEKRKKHFYVERAFLLDGFFPWK